MLWICLVKVLMFFAFCIYIFILHLSPSHCLPQILSTKTRTLYPPQVSMIKISFSHTQSGSQHMVSIFPAIPWLQSREVNLELCSVNSMHMRICMGEREGERDRLLDGSWKKKRSMLKEKRYGRVKVTWIYTEGMEWGIIGSTLSISPYLFLFFSWETMCSRKQAFWFPRWLC